MLWLLCFAASLALAQSAVLKNGVVIPTYAKVCHRSDPNFNECFKESIQKLIPSISKDGIKEVQLGSLDPVFIPELLMSMKGFRYSFNSILKNTTNKGMANVRILDVRSNFEDPENINLEIDFFIPKIVIRGSYKTDGIIADISVNGKGPYNISMTDIQGTLKINGHVIKKEGVEYLRIHRVGMRPEVGDMVVFFGNLVDGNPELSQIAVTFFNQFWRMIYEQVLPYTEDSFDKVLRGMMNRATLKIPYEQLIPL